MAMRRRTRNWLIAGVAAAALAIPALGQDAPQSLLPPGFGEAPPPEQAPSSAQPSQKPAPGKPPAAPEGTAATLPELLLNKNAPATPEEKQQQQEDIEQARQKFDLPDYARLSLDRIGVLTPASHGLAPDAFGRENGRYLSILLQKTHAPVISRWASIVLRRALLSSVDTPPGVNGADWAAERAWLLLRMGEADSARLIVQSVDAADFTPRLFAIAMQTYLATADPAGLCPLAGRALKVSREPGWQMTQAMCASLSGDQAMASAFLNDAERRHVARGIDFHLAEKVAGAGLNARRSVNIEWTGVDRLTVWRYGLATATGVEIPANLWQGVGPHVRAWQARAPLLPMSSRLPAVNIAARLGVFSNAAVVGFYSGLAEQDDATPAAAQGADWMKSAYMGADVATRIDAMRQFWTRGGQVERDFGGYVAMARAAARLPVTDEVGDNVAPLIASMLSAGLDRNAAAWSDVVGKMSGGPAQDAWAMLAVGLPAPGGDLGYGRISDYRKQDDSAAFIKTRMLVAGLAGLGRMSREDVARIAPDIGYRMGYASRWTRAIDAAARRGESGTVALLAAVGMQGRDWSQLPPEHLLHIVAAMRRVGMEPEARMIAAEAIARL